MKVDPSSPDLLDPAHGVRHGREASLPQDVDLDQADLLHGIHVVLAHHDPLGGPLQGDPPVQQLASHHEPPGMDREVPGEAVDRRRAVKGRDVRFLPQGEVPRLRVGGDRFVGIAFQPAGKEPGEMVDVRRGGAEGEGRIAEGGAEPVGHEGGDHGHVPCPVLPIDVIDHLVAPLPADIHVDVRAAGPLGVEEALEVEVVLHRVDAGHSQQEGHHRAGGRTAPHGRDLPRPGEGDEIVNDEEVAGEPHGVDDPELLLDALHHLGPDGAVELHRPVEDKPAEPGVGRLARVESDAGELRRARPDPEAAFLCHAPAAGHRLAGLPRVRQKRGESNGMFHERSGRGQGARSELGDRGGLPDGREEAMDGKGVRLAHVGRCRDRGPQAEPVRRVKNLRRGMERRRVAMAAFPLPACRPMPCRRRRPGPDPPVGHDLGKELVPVEMPGEPGQESGVGHKNGQAAAQLGEVAAEREARLQVATGQEGAEVAVSLVVPRQDDGVLPVLFEMRPDDRLDSRLAARLGKGHGRVEGVGVGDGRSG